MSEPNLWSLWPHFSLIVIFTVNIYVLYSTSGHRKPGKAVDPEDAILVSYSYFEKDTIQKANAEFFWKLGMGVHSALPAAPDNMNFVIVVNGKECSPCKELYPLMKPEPLPKPFSVMLRRAWSNKQITLLWRTENEGMDFAAHNVTLEWVKKGSKYSRYRYFIFLNSSVRGPFVPSYMPPGWWWYQAFTKRLSGDILGVSSSLVCLSEVDAGGPGPKMESWAFALSRQGLDLVVDAGVFRMRKCKLCTGDDGIVVQGEYGLSTVLLSAGFNIATLMSKYRANVDWRDPANWVCNNQVHPSRHGTYDGISQHPFETTFVKASWHVGQPHLDAYSKWFWSHSQGSLGTEGSFDERMYHYAISMQAQEPNYAGECFRVLDHGQTL